MRETLVILGILFFSGLMGYGQKNDSLPNASDFYPENQIGFKQGSYLGYLYGHPDIYRAQAPQSLILSLAIVDDLESNRFSYENTDPNRSVTVFFENYKNPDKDANCYFHSRYHLGLSFVSSSNFNYRIINRESFEYGTMSSTLGDVYYLDSVVTKDIRMIYNTEEIQINLAYFVSTDPAKRFSFYAGAGLNLGYSFSTEVEFKYTENYEIIMSEQNFYGNNQYTEMTHSFGGERIKEYSEKFQVPNSFSLNVSIPIGVDFRLGSRDNFFGGCHLFAEFHPGIGGIIMTNYTPQFRRNDFIGFGIRFAL